MNDNSKLNMPNQIHAKIISLGDTEVGKSCLIKKYCEGKFVPE